MRWPREISERMNCHRQRIDTIELLLEARRHSLRS